MTNKKNSKRLLGVAQLIERRLKKLPALIRSEFRRSASRQVSAMTRIERVVDLVTREVERQRAKLEESTNLDTHA